ncbi:hypothetical protein M405DRAFT_938022 [Rhizopogon salebrosus TDB-379]|nr:hypothetical protein M405DRAFT_938022 [Rhizopogon salebrosus TDB-379]
MCFSSLTGIPSFKRDPSLHKTLFLTQAPFQHPPCPTDILPSSKCALFHLDAPPFTQTRPHSSQNSLFDPNAFPTSSTPSQLSKRTPKLSFAIQYHDHRYRVRC